MKWRPISKAPTHKSIILATTYAGDGSPHHFIGCGYLDWDGQTWRWDSDEPLEPQFNPPTYWMHFPDPPHRGNSTDE